VVSKAHFDDDLKKPTVRRLVDRVGYPSMKTLLDLIAIREIPDRRLADVFAELDAAEDLSDVSPTLSGEDVMELLAIESGPEVGAALSVLQERRYEQGPLDREAEVAFLFETYRR